MSSAALAVISSVALARSRHRRRRKRQPTNPNGHDLTIIITTSPIRSNPSTAMIEDTVRSFNLVGGLQACQKIIVCDGYTVTNGKPHYKKGKITTDDADRYQGFVNNLTGLSKAGASLPHTKVIPLSKRSGFAQAVRAGLEHATTTFVLIVQHDQHFIRSFDLKASLEAMRLHSDRLKYLGLPSSSTLKYQSQTLSKFNVVVKHTDEFGIRLLPLIFFYDKPHICSVKWYKSFVFGPESPLGNGDFIEETLGKFQRRDIIANGMQAHGKYGTYQLEDSAASAPVVMHVHGRVYLTAEQRIARGWPAERKWGSTKGHETRSEGLVVLGKQPLRPDMKQCDKTNC